jgi:hypothetical protein
MNRVGIFLYSSRSRGTPTCLLLVHTKSHACTQHTHAHTYTRTRDSVNTNYYFHQLINSFLLKKPFYYLMKNFDEILESFQILKDKYQTELTEYCECKIQGSVTTDKCRSNNERLIALKRFAIEQQLALFDTLSTIDALENSKETKDTLEAYNMLAIVEKEKYELLQQTRTVVHSDFRALFKINQTGTTSATGYHFNDVDIDVAMRKMTIVSDPRKRKNSPENPSFASKKNPSTLQTIPSKQHSNNMNPKTIISTETTGEFDHYKMKNTYF